MQSEGREICGIANSDPDYNLDNRVVGMMMMMMAMSLMMKMMMSRVMIKMMMRRRRMMMIATLGRDYN